MDTTRALDWPTFELRLGTAADHVEAASTAAHDARELRNRAILDAVDAGFSYRQVADAARVASSHVHRVLAADGETSS